ncbi:hypothetical protein F5888DRAFT_1915047 [Russula emetica]|nr:hypothetical protein F5888DRAFT_1915047 [Russula emetica]
MEKERQEREHRENERREREDAERNLAMRIGLYEDKWAALRGNVIGAEHLSFDDIPWPSLENVRCIEDITEERVLEFVSHPLREHVHCAGGGQARSLRSEMLRWHPDKFEGKVLGTVVNDHREAVREAAGLVARILTTFSAKMR